MSKGRETRDEILELAIGEATRLGLEGLSIGGLARDVGMSKSGLFAHFGSKEGLQISVLQRAADRFGHAVMRRAIQAPRGEPRVNAINEAWLDWADSNAIPGGCLFMSTSFEYDDRPGAVRDALTVHMQQLQDNLRRAAAIAVDVGHFREDLDLDRFAFEWHGLMLGYHVHSRFFRNPRARRMMQTAFERLVADARR